ncbi:MAG: DNA polymerase III subunit chi [Neisseriaceae bacterium]|nr:DNA polymerase III subunit chi [Neisseriaceae bacterium]
MQTQVDFYTNVANVALFSTQLAATVYKKKNRLLILFEDIPTMTAFSVKLWGITPTAFIPNCVVDDGFAPQTPIWLTTQLPVENSPDVLLNLSEQSAPQTLNFNRILEIIGTDIASLNLARNRYKIYKDRGFLMKHHDMKDK